MKRRELVAALLQSQSTLALATGAESGGPQVAPLFYLPAANLCVYWFSSASSAHSRSLRRNPAAAVTVYRCTDRWRDICGVQMRGTVAVVTDRAERRAVAKAYAGRFRLGKVFESAMGRSKLYVFRPAWVRYIDNSRRFGYRFELSL